MSLGLRAARGALWTIISSIGSRILGLVSTIILTRYLEKAEYGAVMVAITIVISVDVFTELGIIQYIVAKPKCDRKTVFHACFYHLILGVAALGTVAIFRAPLGEIFSKDAEDVAGTAAMFAVQTYILGTCISSFFDRLSACPERMLAREIRFGTISLARGSTEVLYAVVAVVLGIYNFGGMAIVYGNIAQWATFAIWLCIIVPPSVWLKPTGLAWEHTRPLLAFGLPLTLGNAAHFASRHWDNLLIARLFGNEVVGRYNLAYNLADIPATHIGEHIGEVLLPSFAQMDTETRQDALLRGTALLSLIVCPMAVGLGAVAPTVTSVVFDPRWATMAPMLAILSALSVFRPIGWTIGSYLQAIDRPSWVMYLEVGKVALLLGCIWALAPLGELWTCAAAGIAFGLHALASIAVVGRLDGIPFLRMIMGLVGPLLACVPMAAAVYGVRYLLAAYTTLQGTLAALIAEITVGGIIFIPAGLIFAPFTSRNLLGLAKKVILRRGGGDDDDEDDDDGDKSEGADDGSDSSH